jgi:prepilin-type processing-associated H-X9-DG protein
MGYEGYNTVEPGIAMGTTPLGVNPPLHPLYTGTRLAPYLESNSDIWLCPSDELAQQGWVIYTYNASYLGGQFGGGGGVVATGTPRRVSEIFFQSETVAIMEGGNNDVRPPSGYGGGHEWFSSARWNHLGYAHMNAVFVDGHVDVFHETDPDLNATDDRLWRGR